MAGKKAASSRLPPLDGDAVLKRLTDLVNLNGGPVKSGELVAHDWTPPRVLKALKKLEAEKKAKMTGVRGGARWAPVKKK